jgi:hypothetical protein
MFFPYIYSFLCIVIVSVLKIIKVLFFFFVRFADPLWECVNANVHVRSQFLWEVILRINYNWRVQPPLQVKGTGQLFAVINTSPTGLISVRNIRDMPYCFGVNTLSMSKSFAFTEMLHYA